MHLKVRAFNIFKNPNEELTKFIEYVRFHYKLNTFWFEKK